MKVGIVGLGYVGLPLAIALNKHFNVIGYDAKESRVKELRYGKDSNNEYNSKDLKKLFVSDDETELAGCNFYIVCVPTPIDEDNSPDFDCLKSASTIVGEFLNKGDIVVYESTVYPGATNEICVPILEEISEMSCGVDFDVGYSPERINPGDKIHTIETITKIIAADNKKTLDKIQKVYSKVCPVYRVDSIKEAEAAKVIENTQRDLNIALVNEFSCIFRKLGLRTHKVLDAASSKWNFLNFRPGLVGGHCIGVDPYYLAYKAQKIGHMPELILAGRRVNENMTSQVLDILIDQLNLHKKPLNGSKVLIMGATFKENVNDTRNSKIEDLIFKIEEKGAKVVLNDPLLKEARFENFKREITPWEKIGKVDAVILAVNHSKYSQTSLKKLHKILKQPIIIDLKNKFNGNPDVVGL